MQSRPFGVELLLELLLQCFLLSVRQGLALDHCVFLGIEDFLLDVLVRGERKVLFSHFLLQHPPVLFSLEQHLVVFPRSVAGQAREVAGELRAGALLAPSWVSLRMLLAVVLASEWKKSYLQGGLQVDTSKSFLLTSQYIPHSSGRVGTNLNLLHTHFSQAVLNFLPK